MRTVIVSQDYGFLWRFRFRNERGAVSDLSAGSTISVVLIAPSGARKERTGAFTTDGTDGLVEYEAVSGDIDEAGGWKIQFVVAGAPVFVKSHEPVLFFVTVRL